jgi:hypothetical protein
MVAQQDLGQPITIDCKIRCREDLPWSVEASSHFPPWTWIRGCRGSTGWCRSGHLRCRQTPRYYYSPAGPRPTSGVGCRTGGGDASPSNNAALLRCCCHSRRPRRPPRCCWRVIDRVNDPPLPQPFQDISPKKKLEKKIRFCWLHWKHSTTHRECVANNKQTVVSF